MIRRHSPTAIAMHWFNAFCWIFLLFSGFGMLSNASMQPIGDWWAALWTGIFGTAGLFRAHIAIGCLWIGVYAVYLAFRFSGEALPFLREITNINLKSDMLWNIKKGLWLVTDAKTMRRFGIDPELPPQGFYNAGQKMVAVLAVLASLGLMLTGGLMLYFLDQPGTETFIQWCLLLHFCAAGGMAILLPVHIYMAAFAPGEAPALWSMFTGFVPVDHIRHHNPLWYAKLREEGLIQVAGVTGVDGATGETRESREQEHA